MAETWAQCAAETLRFQRDHVVEAMRDRIRLNRKPDCWFNMYGEPVPWIEPYHKTERKAWIWGLNSMIEGYPPIYRVRVYLKPSSPNTGS